MSDESAALWRVARIRNVTFPATSFVKLSLLARPLNCFWWNKHKRKSGSKKAVLHLLVTPELTAHHSGLFSHHCRQCPVLLALLPA